MFGYEGFFGRFVGEVDYCYVAEESEGDGYCAFLQDVLDAWWVLGSE